MVISHSTSSLDKPRERTGQAFWLALGAAALLFLPFILYDRGYFIYYGDFNVQQIPFYRMAHDAIRSGNIFWSWTTDLGANFIGSYSFYLLGSPFFWLTLLFPSAVVPYLMAPLLMLKFALSSLTAYLYLRRFVRPENALLGGLLYAFSGFSMYNIFFNHFHEAIVYFPLMLLGMELTMKDGKRGIFAVSVFLSALSNYYFFIGQAIFLILYWIIRAMSGEWTHLFRRFWGLALEAILGTAMSAVILLPAFYAVIQNPRTENILGGWDLLIYNKPQRLFDILHSFFFPQDIPARASFFPDSDNKWASMSAWLPVFGCTGAIAFFQSRKHTDWLRRLLTLCFFFAVIPGLNALFQLMNWIYYARWYYMFVLFLAFATVKTIDDADTTPVNWKRAFGWTATITAAFALFVGLTPKSWKPNQETGKLEIGLYKYPDLFWIAVAFAVVSLILAALLIRLHHKERESFFGWSTGITVCVIVIFGWYSIGAGKMQSNFDSKFVIEKGIQGKNSFDLPDMDNVRIDFNAGMDNLGMFWQTPTIQAFHSLIPGSVMEFYPTVGVERNVGSRPDTSHYALRSLLSVRWLFDYTNEDNAQYKEESSFFQQEDLNGQTTLKMPGWQYHSTQNDFLIYENEYYIPYGFTYDQYLTRSQYNTMTPNTRELSLLKAIVLEDEDEEKYGHLLSKMNGNNGFFPFDYSQSAYFTDCQERRASAANSFTRDNRGFSATISLPKENLVFFSVPYEEGWSATVNGEPVDILRANVGFMAVPCPAGTDISIRFDYHTPGLSGGIWISLCALLALAMYLFLAHLVCKHSKNALLSSEHTASDTAPVQSLKNSPLAGEPEDAFDLYHYYRHDPSDEVSDQPESNNENPHTEDE